MRRYEVSDERSHKFWEVSLLGRSLQIRFGRIGSSGQRREKEFDSHEEARAAHQRAIEEKLAGGYRLVHDDDLGGEGSSPAAGPDARNPELEAAILAAPEDAQSYLVYGDWLQAQKDPRGELVAVQHALRQEKDPGRFLELRRAELAVLKQHSSYLLGPLLPHVHLFKLEWRLGFLYSARLHLDSKPLQDGELRPEELLELLLGLASTRFLQELGLRASDLDAAAYQTIWVHLGELTLPPLRGLTLGHLPEGSQTPPQTDLGDLSPLLAALPELRRLRLAGRARLGHQHCGALQSLELATSEARLIRWLAASELPRLERLVLHAPELDPDDLAPLLQASGYPALRHLALRTTRNSDALAAALAGTRLMRQLSSLELSMGRLSDDGVEALGRGGKLHGLELLDVSGNQLSIDGVARLEGLCQNLRVGYQSPPEPVRAGRDEDEDGAPLGGDTDEEADRYDEIQE